MTSERYPILKKQGTIINEITIRCGSGNLDHTVTGRTWPKHPISRRHRGYWSKVARHTGRNWALSGGNLVSLNFSHNTLTKRQTLNEKKGGRQFHGDSIDKGKNENNILLCENPLFGMVDIIKNSKPRVMLSNEELIHPHHAKIRRMIGDEGCLSGSVGFP